MTAHMDGPKTTSACDSEAELILRCKLRDPIDQDAWRELWGRYYKLVQWKIRALAPNRPVAVIEELTADTFQKLFQSVRLYDPKRGAVATFVLKLAENITFDENRRAQRGAAQPLPATDEPLEFIPGGETPLDYLADAVKGAESKLAPGDKRVIFRRLLEGQTIPEIVRSSDWSESYVRRVRSECLRAVADVLGRTVK